MLRPVRTALLALPSPISPGPSYRIRAGLEVQAMTAIITKSDLCLQSRIWDLWDLSGDLCQTCLTLLTLFLMMLIPFPLTSV